MSTQAELVKETVTFDSHTFRQALGHFPTGVAIVTTRSPEGRPVGLTINSFASLSLDPPLVLWSLVKHSPSLAFFQDCKHFAIHVISQHQVEAALGFANSRTEDKFSLVSHSSSDEGIPVIDDCIATFICENHNQHDGGDHTLFIGKVIRHDTEPTLAPAVFHRGGFTHLQQQSGD